MKRDVRARISAALDDLPDETIRVLVSEALAAEKDTWVNVVCKECLHEARYTVSVPNWKERAQVLEILANQGKGKPPETIRQTIGVGAIKTLEELEALSNEELAAIASGEANWPEATE
jgi:hypothetical protein